jgi:hypothetical protein
VNSAIACRASSRQTTHRRDAPDSRTARRQSPSRQTSARGGWHKVSRRSLGPRSRGWPRSTPQCRNWRTPHRGVAPGSGRRGVPPARTPAAPSSSSTGWRRFGTGRAAAAPRSEAADAGPESPASPGDAPSAAFYVTHPTARAVKIVPACAARAYGSEQHERRR